MAEKLNFTVAFEDGVFVARCIELDIATDGLTKAEAVDNLKEALICYIANPDERPDRHLGAAGDEGGSLWLFGERAASAVAMAMG